MIDNYGRKIDYLRISVTDLCNLRCRYCMPEKGVKKKEHKDILRFEEIEKVVQAAVKLGISKIRFTGGEPLLRKGLPELISKISDLDGIKDISLTTNGVLLQAYAEQLKKAGLHRVNISLDTLDKNKYREITRGGNLDEALNGIRAAQEVKLLPLKINVVLMGGVNDNEIEDFVNLTVKEDIELRFIELMPLGEAACWDKAHFLSDNEILTRVPRLIPLPFRGHGGIARYYKLPGSKGKIGLISPLSNHFCNYCNRIRLTADGKLKPCLHSDLEIDIRDYKGNMEEFLLAAIKAKPNRHYINNVDYVPVERNMNQIGG